MGRAAKGNMQPQGRRQPPNAFRNATDRAVANLAGSGVRFPPLSPTGSSCQRCSKPLGRNVVEAGGKKYHPECFVCVQCAKRFPGGKYIVDSSSGCTYCEPCYISKKAPKCASCGRPIVGDCIEAGGNRYHPQCFCCTQCKKSFPDGKFVQENGRAYCQTCFVNKKAPKCVKCKNAVVGEGVSLENGDTYHSTCLTCATCATSLRSGQIHKRSSQLYCRQCFGNNFAPKCHKCSMPIVDTSLTALGKQFHPECFGCHRCGKSLKDGKFVELDGRPWCEQHAREKVAPRCAYCQEKILDEKYVSALGRTYHKGHFKCSECQCSLDGKNTFHTANGKPYCSNDFGKLFCPKCKGCDLPVVGEALRALGSTWHPRCFCCAHCSNPIPVKDGFYQHEGQIYCKKDYEANFTPICAICNQRTGSSYLYNFWGDVYCQKHHFEMPKCFSCDRLVACRQGSVDYADGRASCNICATTAVMGSAEAHSIMQKVACVLHELGIQIPDANSLSIRVVDRNTIKAGLKNFQQNSRISSEFPQHHPKQALGLTAKVLKEVRAGRSVNRQRSIDHIALLQGLPAYHMGSVIAHELGHVYLWMKGFPELTADVEEGICELIKFLWLKAVPADAMTTFLLDQMEKNPDQVYGVGFRAARASYLKMSSLKEFFKEV